MHADRRGLSYCPLLVRVPKGARCFVSRIQKKMGKLRRCTRFLGELMTRLLASDLVWICSALDRGFGATVVSPAHRSQRSDSRYITSTPTELLNPAPFRNGPIEAHV